MLKAQAGTDTTPAEAASRLLRYDADIAFRRRARTVVEYLDPQPGDRILDAGCGLGFYLVLLGRTSESEVHGVELDGQRLRTAQASAAGARVYAGDVTRLPFKDGSFDKAILSEVLEHLPDDSAALREVRRVLRPGGVLAITVPHSRYPFLWDPVNYLRERMGLGHFTSEPWSGIWTDHRRLYTLESLQKEVEAAGLEVTESHLETRYSMPFAHYTIYGLGRFLVQRKLVARSSAEAGTRASLWSTDDQPMTPTRAAVSAYTAVDRLNKPRYRSGAAVTACLRAVRPG